MVKILDGIAAVNNGGRKLEKQGYRLISGYRETKYYGKPGSPFKIRISTHFDAGKNDDVLVDVVFDYDTIENDVEVRVNRAASEFERNIQMKWFLRGGKG